MFGIFKKNKNESVGIKKFNRLKLLLKNRDISEALISSASGINQVSIRIATDVNEAVSLVNSLSTLTGISGIELIGAITENKHENQIRLIIEGQEEIEEKDFSNSNNSWIDILIKWANDSNLDQLKTNDPSCPCTGFPRDQKQIINLELLHLTNSNISYLPPELGKLKKLNKIFLDGNNIDTLPKELCYLPHLIRLDIDDNKLSTLPREISNLESLQILSLRNNRIVDLPIEMLKLRNLRKLDLRGQPIHLSSRYSPLSKEGFAVKNHFYDIVKEDSVESWLSKTDTSSLTLTG